ncbi:hypothetical protein [Jiella pelagia]|uniref:Uncharacterized protein n=1 Tax=Jiella pelagia TaxID=2986949 RepID=A0ABY7C8L3_9HYPH|nr:hypothetical protein [Jiella pelagia]WAP71389.1 hypothetical protein OH818_10310 [Jiella pelagia]
MLRPLSTIGEILEADHLGLDRPSFRQIFDHRHLSVAIGPGQLWHEDIDPATFPRDNARDALAFARKASGADSVDAWACHCWVFSPLSFLELLLKLSRARQFGFVISQFASTEPGSSEFFVCLRRDHESDPDVLLKTQENAIHHVRGIALERQRRAKLMAST